jgi:hypothetical protein
LSSIVFHFKKPLTESGRYLGFSYFQAVACNLEPRVDLEDLERLVEETELPLVIPYGDLAEIYLVR